VICRRWPKIHCCLRYYWSYCYEMRLTIGLMLNEGTRTLSDSKSLICDSINPDSSRTDICHPTLKRTRRCAADDAGDKTVD